jgi:hypothetical protein
MNDFPPARRRGLILLSILAVVLAVISMVALFFTFQTQVGLTFAIYFVIFVLTAIPVPILGYRVYALGRANYQLDRNILRLTWGLRIEDIPVTDVEWIRPLKGLLAPINLPFFSLPGGILGVTRQADIGRVEFLAADAGTLVLVATPRMIFAISPEDPTAFLAAFQKTIEMGSLQRGQGLSQYPSFVVARAWENSIVRLIWLAGGLLNIGLLVWVTLLIPRLEKVSLGFQSNSQPLEPLPGSSLILLPLLSAFLFVLDMVSGLFFFRRQEQQILAVILWIAGVLTALFFLVAVYFITTTS